MVSTNNNKLLHTFALDYYSEVDDTQYRGSFTTKKLSIRDKTQLGVRRAQLCGGLHYNPETPGQGLDPDTFGLNSMAAHLELALVDTPEWWDLETLTDLSLLTEVYKEAISFENTFPGSRGKAGGNVSGGSSESESPETEAGTDPAGVVSQVVAGQVSASLEP